MHAAEIRSIREYLGLSHAELAAVLEINPRLARRWETGEQSIGDLNADGIRKIVDITAKFARRHVIYLRTHPQPTLVTYRSDEEMWVKHPHLRPLPARWHRMLSARVAELVPNLTITYGGDR
jgi:transcriptional regulator with XRE-family HTH domain